MTYKLKDFNSNVQLRVFRFLCYFEISVSSQFFVRYNKMCQVQYYSMSVMTHWTIDDLAMVMVVEIQMNGTNVAMRRNLNTFNLNAFPTLDNPIS